MKRIVATAIAVAALLSVATWCQTLGTPDNKISDMPHV
jgi:hypothetical protein